MQGAMQVSERPTAVRACEGWMAGVRESHGGSRGARSGGGMCRVRSCKLWLGLACCCACWAELVQTLIHAELLMCKADGAASLSMPATQAHLPPARVRGLCAEHHEQRQRKARELQGSAREAVGGRAGRVGWVAARVGRQAAEQTGSERCCSRSWFKVRPIRGASPPER